MAEMETHNLDWKPPTEAERKISEAKRERSNKISQLMGTYLLKGHKMLATNCQECFTILMRDKDGKDYCVACTELSTDVGKDDPAVSDEAAIRQVAEDKQRTSNFSDAEIDEDQRDTPAQNATSTFTKPKLFSNAMSKAPTSRDNLPSQSVSNEMSDLTVSDSIDTVKVKLQWSTQQLKQATNPELCIQWCRVVQQCADSLISLYNLSSRLPLNM